MVIVRLRRADGTTERLIFDKPEIAVGRDAAVSDIVITDASVSKNHALIARTSKGVILTDLNSTNGTFVNGAVIARTTPRTLQHGDEIGIGPARIWIDPETLTAPRAKYGAHAGRGERNPPTLRLPETAPGGVSAMTVPPYDLAATGPLPVMATGPLPSGALPTGPIPGGGFPTGPLPAIPGTETERPPKKGANANGAGETVPEGGPSEPLMTALNRLVERVTKTLGADAFSKPTPPPADLIKKLDQALAAEKKALANVPNMSAAVVEQAVAAARREFVELGPIGPWLEDTEISHIQCARHDRIELTRNGKVVRPDIVFSSGAAAYRAMRRLTQQSGKPWAKGELVVERRLQNGHRLVALIPPTAGNRVSISIRKRQGFLRAMGDLVTSRALSDGMATFLTRCVRARLNILVCGENERVVAEIVAALASAAPEKHRIAVVQAGCEVRIKGRRTFSFGLSISNEERVLRAVTRLGFEQTLVLSPLPKVAASAVGTIASGAMGVVVGLPARSLERALSMTVGELVLDKPGLPHSAASLLAAHSFEVGIEVKMVNGRLTVVRIAEVEPRRQGEGDGSALRDLFVTTDAENGKVVFTATGTTSRHLAD